MATFWRMYYFVYLCGIVDIVLNELCLFLFIKNANALTNLCFHCQSTVMAVMKLPPKATQP